MPFVLEGDQYVYRTPREPGVYLVAAPSVGRFKIGRTKQMMHQRLTALQSGSPVELELVELWRSDDPIRDEEIALSNAHLRFKHSHREWFFGNPGAGTLKLLIDP